MTIRCTRRRLVNQPFQFRATVANGGIGVNGERLYSIDPGRDAL